MPRAVAVKNYFQFNKGLITEATGLSYPENSMKAAVNIDINYDGSVSRRKGLAYETDHALSGVGVSLEDNAVIQTFLWENAGTLKDSDILVVRHSDTVRFYDTTQGAVSGNYLGQIALPPAAAGSTVCFEKGSGFLLIASENMDTRAVEYDGLSFTTTNISPKIRDLEGLDDGLENNERPFNDPWNADSLMFTDINIGPAPQSEYLYNLTNQGWPAKKVLRWTGSVPHYSWYYFRIDVGSYPAHSDKYISEDERYDARPEKSQDASTSDPVKGRLIIDAFNINRASALTSISDYGSKFDLIAADIDSRYGTDSIDERPSAVGFFQGHVLIGSVNNSRYASKIFVSQSVRKVSDISKCYSVNDPTDDIESSPLDTDGGIITIAGLGHVYAFRNLGPYCVIFSNTGIWSLRASEDSVFSINNVIVDKLSDVGATGYDNIVPVDSAIVYWTNQGIYSVSPSSNSLSLSVQNISENTIQTLYNTISSIQKNNTAGILDKNSRKVYWMYNSNLTSESGFRSYFNKALVLDLRLESFYEYSFKSPEDSNVLLSAPFFKKDLLLASNNMQVLAGTDELLAGTDEVIIQSSQSETYEVPSVSFIAVVKGVTDSLTVVQLTSRSFSDLEGDEDYLYNSYLETGHEILQEPGSVKQITSMHCYFNRTEESFVDREGSIEFDFPSGCIMTTKWEWTSTGTANRWSEPQQVYRFRAPFIPGGNLDPFDYDYEVITTRNKVRGKGKAISFRFESEDGKDFQLLGWSVDYSGTTKI